MELTTNYHFSRDNWPGYPIGILVCLGGPPQTEMIKVLEEYGCSQSSCLKEWSKWNDDKVQSLGHTVVFPCHRVAMWFPTYDPSPVTVAHECFHAAYGALPQLGIKLCDETEEVYAYAMGSLHELVIKTISNATAKESSNDHIQPLDLPRNASQRMTEDENPPADGAIALHCAAVHGAE